MREFARQRPDYLFEYLKEFLALSDTSNLVLDYDPAQGTILIDSIDLSNGSYGVNKNGRWTGRYFNGIPVHISVIAAPGYQFSHWLGIDDSASDINIEVSEDILITAIFKPIE